MAEQLKIEDISQHLNTLKLQALDALGVDPSFESKLALAKSPNPEMGDWGFPVFALQGPLKDRLSDVPGKERAGKIAQMVADEMRQLIQDDALVESVSTEGAYVNIALNTQAVSAIVIKQALTQQDHFGAGFAKDDTKHWMIEYSAPNTNKPQHLGHVRNNLLGQAVATILEGAGHKVTRVNLINDRGIHICKSMLAYKLKGEGKTPESEGIKGDHFVGHFYVVFNTLFEQEYALWQTSDAAQTHFEQWQQGPKGQRLIKKLGDDATDEALKKAFFKSYKDTYFNTDSDLGQQAKAMLVAWEEGQTETINLWRMMNQWVFDGFDQTYDTLGITFDEVYYESQTYKLGKDIVVKGLEDGLFERVEGGAIACPMKKIGLKGPDKILLRSNGTSVYMTQDLGTALKRFDDYGMDEMIYVVGDEQNHHFKQLFGLLGLLRPELKDTCTHLGYGMIDLPSGRMKSREGTVVDADDLVKENIALSAQQIVEKARDAEREPPAQEIVEQRSQTLGLAGLKYYILDYNPKTRFVFDPAKSIDPQGRSGVYLLYAYARIHSIAAEVGGWPELDASAIDEAINALGTEQEVALIQALQNWPHMYQVAATHLDPSKVTEGLYDVARAFSTLYNHGAHIIKNIEGPRRDGLLLLLKAVTHTLKTGLNLIGVEPIERM